MQLTPRLTRFFTQLISETSGISLEDTLVLAEQSQLEDDLAQPIREFHTLLETLLAHPVSRALEEFFRAFPIPFHDEHIHALR